MCCPIFKLNSTRVISHIKSQRQSCSGISVQRRSVWGSCANQKSCVSTAHSKRASESSTSSSTWYRCWSIPAAAFTPKRGGHFGTIAVPIAFAVNNPLYKERACKESVCVCVRSLARHFSSDFSKVNCLFYSDIKNPCYADFKVHFQYF